MTDLDAIKRAASQPPPGDAPDLREALRAFGERLAADGYGWEAIITRETPSGEQTVAHLTTANPDPAALAASGDAPDRVEEIELAYRKGWDDGIVLGRRASQPPSGDAPDRNAIIVAAAGVLRNWLPDVGSTDRATVSAAIADAVLAASAPSSPTTPAPLDAHRLWDVITAAGFDIGPTDCERIARAYAEQEGGGPDGPTVGQVVTIAGTTQQVRWTGHNWEPV